MARSSSGATVDDEVVVSPATSPVVKRVKLRHKKTRAAADAVARGLLREASEARRRASERGDVVVGCVAELPPGVEPVLDAPVVHRLRDPRVGADVRGVLCVRASPSRDRVAVSREGGSVETVDPRRGWRRDGRVAGTAARSVDLLAWSTTHRAADGVDDDVTFSSAEQRATHSVRRRERLFGGSGSDGTVFEIDFRTGRHARVTGSGGGAVLAMERCGDGVDAPLAVGCEDGRVRLLRVPPDDDDDAPLSLFAALPAVGAPVTALACSPTGDAVHAAAADGTLRSFLRSSSSSSRYEHGPRVASLPTRGATEPTRAWALEVADGGRTLVTGDSAGGLRFWDADTMALRQSFAHNEYGAPVSCLAVFSGATSSSTTSSRVFASGVDDTVACAERAPNGRWVLTHRHRPHTHDVRSLAIVDDEDADGRPSPTLVSGGVDTKLCVYKVKGFKAFRPRRVFDLPERDRVRCGVVVVDDATNDDQQQRQQQQRRRRRGVVVSVRRDRRWELFALDTADTNDTNNNNNNNINNNNTNINNDKHKGLRELAVADFSSSTKHNTNCDALSKDGRHVAVGDAQRLKVLRVDYETRDDTDDDSSPLLLSASLTEIATHEPCTAATLHREDDSSPLLLVAATAVGPVRVSRVDGDSLVPLHAFSEHRRRLFTAYSSSQPASIAEVVVGRGHVAVARELAGGDAVHAWRLDDGRHYAPPALDAPPAALGVARLGGPRDDHASLVVAATDRTFVMFDLDARALSDYTRDCGRPSADAFPDYEDDLRGSDDLHGRRDRRRRPDPSFRLRLAPSSSSSSKDDDGRRFLLGGHGSFVAVDLGRPIPDRARCVPGNGHLRAGGRRQRRRRERSGSEHDHDDDETNKTTVDLRENNFTVCVRYDSVLATEFVGPGEMVVVEQPWTDVTRDLPDTLERRAWGS